MTDYDPQERGDDQDYERYLAGMDASMQQKVALTAAHVLTEGKLADMGMGSGTGSDALAGLYPTIQVIGVDINPEMVTRAQKKYKRKNLDFVVGDIAERCFGPESLDTVFNSSVLHHVTSFNGYDHQRAKRAVLNQVRQLKFGGCLIVRDFVRTKSREVRLELPAPLAALLERFATEFKSLNPPESRGFSLKRLTPATDGWESYLLDEVHAVEFVLRKDYVEDWDTEILEEYSYFTQEQFEGVFQECGLRVLASTPIYNPWIVKHRFEGQFRIFNSDGELQEFPPTNYLIVGERVRATEAVDWRPQPESSPISYLKFSHFEDRTTGAIRDMVRRPFTTLDVVPYFVQNDEVYVVARRSYARPVLRLNEGTLDGSRSPSFVTEPIVVVTGEEPLAESVEKALEEWAGLTQDSLKSFRFGSTTYPSPGGLCEQVQSVFVEIEPVMSSRAKDRVRAVSARQLLRSAQVGGLPDARLEMHCFELLDGLGITPGSWIGATLELNATEDKSIVSEGKLPLLSPRRRFLSADKKADFLHLGCREFRAESFQGEVTSQLTLEYVVPKHLSLQTVSMALLKRVGGEVWMGLCEEDFPAAQCFSGNSGLLVVPAWRLPKGVDTLSAAVEFLQARLQHEHNLEVTQVLNLGGVYYPSPGVTPEALTPMLCEVVTELKNSRGIIWVKLKHVLSNFSELRDGHLKTTVLRASRALALNLEGVFYD